MRRTARSTLTALATAALAVTAALPATASTDSPGGEPAGAVFVQLNGTDGNEVAAYSRAADGGLTPAGHYGTAGKGGTAVGAPVDALASQGSLTLAGGGRVLLAVNAGSDTVTSFAVRGTHLRRESVVASGGHFPVSVAAHGDLVYVVNGGGDGSVSGFRLSGAHLLPIPGSTRSLRLGNTNPPAFLASPAQVGISPDGTALVVTTKSKGTIVGFALRANGRPAAAAHVTASAGPVPFAFVWGGGHTLYVSQAGDGRVVTYSVRADGSAVLRGSSAPSGQAALCWLTRAGGSLFGANAGSGSLTSWATGSRQVATLVEPAVATPGGHPIDLTTSRDGRFLYQQDATAGTVSVFRVNGSTLSAVQTVTGLPVYAGTGMEGIAAS